MPEWIAWANFALNMLVLPLLAFLWRMSTSITRLEVQIEHADKTAGELRIEISGLRNQLTAVASAAAAAAATAATVVAELRTVK